VRAAEIEQPPVAYEEQNQDSPDQVMDMPAAHHDPVEWTLAVFDERDEQANSEECDKE